MIEAVSIIFTLAVILSVLNYKFLRLPNSIGLFLLGVLFAIMVIISASLFPAFHHYFKQLIIEIEFKKLLLNGLLGLLLFSGSIHVNLKELDCSKWAILLFSTTGVIITAGITGICIYYAGLLLGLQLPFTYALLFGSLIAPTDPVAVLSILGKSSLSKSLTIKFEGESLFNDGVGVILFSGIFLVINSISDNTTDIVNSIGLLLLEEIGGGLLFGAVLGLVGYRIMLYVKDNPMLATMVSLAVVIGGYLASQMLHISGPLAMVISGLIIGNKLHLNDACEPIQHSVTDFWKNIDNMLNAIVFFLMGLILQLLNFEINTIVLGMLAILIALASRFIGIFLPYTILGHQSESKGKATVMLTWGGLRGGISIALALGVSEMQYGDTILLITFCVVFFSIVVQGLTVKNVYMKLFK